MTVVNFASNGDVVAGNESLAPVLCGAQVTARAAQRLAPPPSRMWKARACLAPALLLALACCHGAFPSLHRSPARERKGGLHR